MSTGAWSRDDSMRYLNQVPLPAWFRWHHRDDADPKSTRVARPVHSAVTGYGKWLRETPYFPGLFELVHEVLVKAEELGDSEWLGHEVKKFHEAEQKQQELI